MIRPGLVVADRYYVEALVGVGGMGAVYRAVHIHLGKPVALKILTTDPDERTVRRFVQEGIALARVRHRAIVDVYDAGSLDGRPWLAMELLEGESLGARLGREKRLDPLSAVSIASDVLGGLAVAHDAGIVHRDLKPDNIFLARTADGEMQPKILDFGIALLRTVARQTSEGSIIGTAYYLSPEQARGDADIDGRSDLYALGVVLFEALAGSRPFEAATFPALVAQILFDVPAQLATVAPHLPRGLSDLVMRALSKDRAERPADARSFRSELRAALTSIEGQPVPRLETVASERHPAQPSEATVTTSAPAPTDAFVGRERELGELRALLAAGHRVITILGPGGTGKTRLATRLAREWMRTTRPAGGVSVVELEEVRDADAFAATVGQALAIPLAGAVAPAVAVATALSTRGPMLLVLDNVEQLGGAIGAPLARWLEAAPALQVVATSQKPLRVDGEHPFELDPLPDEDGVRLFLERAQVVRRGTSELDPGLVRDLVRRLDGIPLALELAAARLAVMTLEQLASRLDQRFRLLTSQRTDVPARQATMRAAIDWSWELLSDAERDALAQCAVFRGGFDLEAAEAVLDLSRHPGEPWAADVLAGLRDRSLVRSRTDTSGGGPERVRLSMLETIREYAEEKLVASGAAERVAARHAAHYAAAGRKLVVGVRRGTASASRAAVAREEANLLAVADRAIADPSADRASPGLEALAVLDETMGYRFPGALLERLDALLAAVDRAAVDAGALARAIAARGRMRAVRDDDRCYPDLQEALELGRRLGDLEVVRTSLTSWGAIEYKHAQLDLAEEKLAQALQVSGGEPWWQARTLVLVGYVRWHRGDIEGALAAAQTAWQAAQQSGDRGQEAYALSSLGLYTMQRGLVDQALAYERQAMELAREAERKDLELMNVHNIGFCLHEQGRLAEAITLYEQAVRLARVTGHRAFEGVARCNRGVVELERGDRETARAWLTGGIEMLASAGDRRFLGYHQAWLAVLHALDGQLPSATAALEAAIQTVAPLGDRLIGAAIDVLGAAVDEMRARDLVAHGDAERARTLRAAARDRVEAFRALGDRSDLVRMSVRFASRTLGAMQPTEELPLRR